MATSARDKILDAYERRLLSHGERGATVEAVAREAEVSKGGLLYHFSSKEALVNGLMDRLEAAEKASVSTPDHDALPSHSLIDRLLRVTLPGQGHTFNRTATAAQILVASGNRFASHRMMQSERDQLNELTEKLGDEFQAKLVLLVADGLYFRTMLAAEATSTSDSSSSGGAEDLLPDEDDLAQLVDQLSRGSTPPSAGRSTSGSH